MIFVDWISTPDHRNFNISFFKNFTDHKNKLYVFSDKLIIDEIQCINIKSGSTRLNRLKEILKLCFQNKRKSIFFLTYDPLFLPILSFLIKKVYTYEHNTVPEMILSKHAIFQFLFYRNIVRFAQYKGQEKMLIKLKQNVKYVGSPLLPFEKKKLFKK